MIAFRHDGKGEDWWPRLKKKKADTELSAPVQSFCLLVLNRLFDLLARDSFVLKASVSEGPIALELDGGRANSRAGFN